MIILLFNIFLILLEALFLNIFVLKKQNAVKLFLLIVFAQLFILHAFLDPNRMVDLPGYIESFALFARNSLHESIYIGYAGVKMEPGWIILCKCLSFISSNPRILLITTSIIIICSYLVTIHRYSKIPWLSVFLFLCTTFDQSLYVIRQHSAIAICMLSIPFVLEKKQLKFLLVILVASLFHSTAIIMLPFYYVYNRGWGRFFLAKFVVVVFCGWFFANNAFEWLFNNTWYDSYANKEGSNLTEFMISGCVCLLSLVAYKWNVKKMSNIDKCLFLMVCFSLAISIWGAGFSPTNRLIRYYTVSSIVLIPNSVNQIKEPYIRLSIIGAVIFFYIMLFFSDSNIEYISNYRLQI